MPEWDQRVAVFVDVSNLYYSAVEIYKGHIDYEKFLEFAVRGRRLIRAITYTVAPLDPERESAYVGFVEALKKAGYEVREKKPKIIDYGGEGRKMSVKANWDMGIAMDAISISLVGKINVAVLASGDGDFADLAAFLRSHGVKVEIYAFKHNAAVELIKTADEFYDLNQVWGKIAYQPEEALQKPPPPLEEKE